MHSFLNPPNRHLIRLALFSFLSVPLAATLAAARPAVSQLSCEPYWEPTFGGAHGVDGAIRCMTEFDFGGGSEVVAGGTFQGAGGVFASGIARWNGAEWLAFDEGLRTLIGDGTVRGAQVNALQIFDDGTGDALYVGGSFTHAGALSTPSLARFDGSSWTTAGSNFFLDVHAFTVFDDGNGAALYAAATEKVPGQPVNRDVFRLESGNWVSIGLAGGIFISRLTSLESFDDGTGPALYVGGTMSSVAGQSANGLARWDGSTWTGLQDSLLGQEVNALRVFDAGAGPELYVAPIRSPFTTTSPVVRFDGTDFDEVGSNMVNSPSAPLIARIVRTLEVRTDALGQSLYAGGFFSLAGEVNDVNVARLTGSDWEGIGVVNTSPILTSFIGVQALQFFTYEESEQLIAGGGFRALGGVRASNVAVWNGTAWSPTNRGTDGEVSALLTRVENGTEIVYAGGDFSMISGVDAAGVAAWNGSVWSALGSGADGRVRALVEFDDGSGSAIYAGGSFTMMGGAGASGVARWDGANWQPLSLGPNSFVNTLAVHDDGTGPALYAGGDLTIPGSLQFTGVARWTGTTWERLGSGLAIGGSILDMESVDLGNGPRLFAGGSARVESWDGATWTRYSVFGGGPVYALKAFGRVPALYVGGLFSIGQQALGNQLLRFDGTSWSQVVSSGFSTEGFDGVYELGVHDDGTGPSLIIGGQFHLPATEPLYGLAKLSGNDILPFAGGLTVGRVRALSSYRNSLIVGGDRNLIARDSGDYSIARVGCAADFLAVEYCASGTPNGAGCGACPCANEASGVGGCLHSQGGSAHLSASGSTSVLTDDLQLGLTDATTNTFALLVSGADALPLSGPCPSGSGVIGLGLLDGIRCVGGPDGTRRHGARATDAAGTVTQPWGSLSGTWLMDVGLDAGMTRSFQVFYRDDIAAGCGTGRNTSNAVRITAVP